MTQRRTADSHFRTLAGVIGIVQVLDILIHAATGQLEPIRVASNLIILLWLTVLGAGLFSTHRIQIAIGAILVYLVLNGAFLAREGFFNSVQGGGLRWLLFLLVLVTVVSAGLLTSRVAPRT